jgi:F0F1-type ATP synthase assembly protein I
MIRYIYGFLIGMIFEYLIKIEFNVIPLTIIILMLILIIIKEKTNVFKNKN